MKRRILWLVLAAVLIALAGCGGSDTPVFETSIESEQAIDGDIFQPADGGARTVSPAGQNVLVGITAGGEYRSFLSFPLASLPLNAIIRSARLTVTLVPPTNDIPLEMELVSFAPSAGLIESYYEGLPAYASAMYSLPVPDINHRVSFNVTSLVAEAQRRGFDDFQVRIMENLDFSLLGLVEISESNATPPQLTIVYE